MEDLAEIKTRLAKVEQVLEDILKLPQMTNLATREFACAVQRVQDTKQGLNEQEKARVEYLVLPTLTLEPCDN